MDEKLRSAVERLMAFRHEVLRRQLYTYVTPERYSSATAELRLFNDPVWHQLEEALK